MAKTANFPTVLNTVMAKDTQKDYLTKFGRHLKTLRKNKKLSLRKLAANCNIEHADITRYEKGEINLTLMSLMELAKGLEISPKELLDF
jgi:transcriptional regulator with XRE-family HTH domain